MPGYPMQAGFDQSGLSMDNDLGDPRRQSRLPGDMQLRVKQYLHLMRKLI